MKNKILFGILVILTILITIAGATAQTLENDTISYWTFDNDDISGSTVIDIVDSNNGTNNGATTGQTGIIKQSFDFVAANSDYVQVSDNSNLRGMQNVTVNIWINPDTTTQSARVFEQDGSFIVLELSNGGDAFCRFNDGTTVFDVGFTQTDLTAGSWNMVTCRYSGATQRATIWLNGVLKNNISNNGNSLSNSVGDLYIGSAKTGAGPANFFNGFIDEMSWFNSVVSSTDINTLYNSGNGLQYPYPLVALTTIQTTPNLITNENQNITANTTITSELGTANITAKWLNSSTVLKQTTFNNTNNGTTINYSLNCPDFSQCKIGETLTITFNATDGTSTAFQTKNVTIGLELIVNVKSNTGNSINNFTANVTNTDNTTNTFQKTTTSNNASFVINDGNYSVNVFDVSQGSTDYSTANANITLDQTSEQINLTVFLTNSFDLTFRNEEDRELLDNINISVEFLSDLEAIEHNTSNGTLFVHAFMPAEIEIRYNAPGFRERSYYHFLSNQSFNNITLYLLNQSTGTLSIVDVVDESGASIQDSVLQVLRGYIINGQQEFEIVEMDKTDFSGEAVISVELNEPIYKIRIVKNVQNNTVIFLSDGFEITNNILSITGNLLGDSLEGFNSWQTITYTKPNFDSNTWTASYTDNGGVINPGGEVCLVVDKTIGVSLVRVNKVCSSSTSAVLTVDYNDSNHGSIATLEADTNTENSVHVLSVSQTLAGTREQIAENLGVGGAFLTSILVYTVSSFLIFNPTTYVLGVILGLVSGFVIGLVNFTWGGTLITMIIIGGIVAFKTNS